MLAHAFKARPPPYHYVPNIQIITCMLSIPRHAIPRISLAATLYAHLEVTRSAHPPYGIGHHLTRGDAMTCDCAIDHTHL